jgi:hypothetical protein
MSAETGVGPSIASGNQTCNPSCADLPIAAHKKKKAITTFKLFIYELFKYVELISIVIISESKESSYILTVP